MREQRKKLKEKATKWTDEILAGHLPRWLVKQSFTTRLERQLDYPLAATTLTLQECEEIQNVYLGRLLQKTGYAKGFSRALTFGPHHYHGMNFPHLYDTQGIEQIDRLLRLGPFHQHPTGNWMQQSFELLTLEADISTPLLESPYELGLIGPCLVGSNPYGNSLTSVSSRQSHHTQRIPNDSPSPRKRRIPDGRLRGTR